MEFSAKFEGFDDLQKQLQGLVTLAKEKQLTQNALFYASDPMFKEIKQQAPRAEKQYFRYYRGSFKSRLAGNPQNSRKLVKPGTLSKSIARKRIRLDGAVGVGIYVKSKAFYFRFIEKGTPTIIPVPFIRPAYDHNKEQAVGRFIERYRIYIMNAMLKRASR